MEMQDRIKRKVYLKILTWMIKESKMHNDVDRLPHRMSHVGKVQG